MDSETPEGREVWGVVYAHELGVVVEGDPEVVVDLEQ